MSRSRHDREYESGRGRDPGLPREKDRARYRGRDRERERERNRSHDRGRERARERVDSVREKENLWEVSRDRERTRGEITERGASRDRDRHPRVRHGDEEVKPGKRLRSKSPRPESKGDRGSRSARGMDSVHDSTRSPRQVADAAANEVSGEIHSLLFLHKCVFFH